LLPKEFNCAKLKVAQVLPHLNRPIFFVVKDNFSTHFVYFKKCHATRTSFLRNQFQQFDLITNTTVTQAK